MGSKPSAPKPLDVDKVSTAQTKQNDINVKQQSAYNRVDQTDALGNKLNYVQTGTDANGNPTFTANQQYGDIGQDYVQGLAGLGQQYFDAASQFIGNRPALGAGDAFERAYDTASANIEPRFQRSQEALDNKLKNQGFSIGDEGYKNSMNDLALQQNESRNDLTTRLQGQLFNQGLQDRASQVGELSQLAAPGIQFGNKALTPGYANIPGIAVPNVDLTSLYRQSNQDQWNNYNSQMQSYNGMLGGIAGLGSTFLTAPMAGGGSAAGAMMSALPFISDERVKENIERVGQMDSGLPIYRYTYVGENRPQIGVLAQEAEQFDPSSVVEINGLKHVHYNRLK
jgi:hypothetical protein